MPDLSAQLEVNVNKSDDTVTVRLVGPRETYEETVPIKNADDVDVRLTGDIGIDGLISIH